MLGSVALGLAVLVGIGGAAARPEAVAQRWDRRDDVALDVGRVEYPGGYFVEGRRGDWIEYASDGRVKARFVETGRTDGHIDLDDATRDLQIRLNIRGRVIEITERRGAWRRLYAINGTRPGAGDRAGRGRYDRRRDRYDRRYDDRGYDDRRYDDRDDMRSRDLVREVAAGVIFNQVDAQVKCQGVAIRERGEWTGQWRTTQGQQGLCEIRYRQ